MTSSSSRRTGELRWHSTTPRADPSRLIGLAFMEFIQPTPTWEQFHQRPQARASCSRRSGRRGGGERLILEDNVFIERVLPSSVLRKLSDEEMDAYRAPFPTPASRKPILKLPNELPIAGNPSDVYATLEAGSGRAAGI